MLAGLAQLLLACTIQRHRPFWFVLKCILAWNLGELLAFAHNPLEHRVSTDWNLKDTAPCRCDRPAITWCAGVWHKATKNVDVAGVCVAAVDV